jgi:lipopolysaccharide export system protein LptC
MQRRSMTSTAEDMRGYRPGTGADSQRVFVTAQRHSRNVRRLRIAIPAVMVAAVFAMTLASWLDPLRILARLPTDSGRLVISGTKITMESPKLSGFTKDSRPYELNARSAAQDITNPDVVELTDIRAKLQSTDKSPINVTAVDGRYHRKSGILNLSRDVVLTTPAYQVNLTEATVDTASSHVVSNQPVQVKMLQGVLHSNRLEVTNGGEVVLFEGNVKLTLDDLPAKTATAQ